MTNIDIPTISDEEKQALIDGDNPQWIATPTAVHDEPGEIGIPANAPVVVDEIAAHQAVVDREPQPGEIGVPAEVPPEPEPEPEPIPEPEPEPVVEEPQPEQPAE